MRLVGSGWRGMIIRVGFWRRVRVADLLVDDALARPLIRVSEGLAMCEDCFRIGPSTARDLCDSVAVRLHVFVK